MDAYVREHRLSHQGPLWPLAGFYLLGSIALFREGFDQVLAGAPLFAVLGYALAAGFANHVRTRADRHGIQVTYGPLPVAPAPASVRREQVAKVYVRHAVMPSKTGGGTYLAAGVERTDGRWYDVSQPFLTDAQVWNEARELAAALEWNRPIEELWGTPPARDWQAMRAVWYWTGAFLGGIAWGCAAPFMAT